MAHELTIEQLKEQYRLADSEGRKWLAKVQGEKEYTLNVIVTIHMNACTQIKAHIKSRVGELVIEAKD
jgi:hypothetical protein